MGIWALEDNTTFTQLSSSRVTSLGTALASKISLFQKSHLLFGSGWHLTVGDLSFPVLLCQPQWRGTRFLSLMNTCQLPPAFGNT